MGWLSNGGRLPKLAVAEEKSGMKPGADARAVLPSRKSMDDILFAWESVMDRCMPDDPKSFADDSVFVGKAVEGMVRSSSWGEPDITGGKLPMSPASCCRLESISLDRYGDRPRN